MTTRYKISNDYWPKPYCIDVNDEGIVIWCDTEINNRSHWSVGKKFTYIQKYHSYGKQAKIEQL